MLETREAPGRPSKSRLATHAAARVPLLSWLFCLVLGCVHESTPTVLGHEGERRVIASSELPAEHRSTTMVHGVVHTITAPRAGYLRCGPDTVATIEADTTQRPNAYELATVDGEHPRLSRALCLHRIEGGFTVVVQYNKIAVGYRRHPFLHSGRSYVFADIPLSEEDLDAFERVLRHIEQMEGTNE